MIRNKSSSAMQKTYDDCYLICSTAVYFESQNNEAEALRSWKNALDQIYYHNAFRVSSQYQPRSETERALQDSLKQLELQCKERVDLLEALKQSREEAQKEKEGSAGEKPSKLQPPVPPKPPIHAPGSVSTTLNNNKSFTSDSSKSASRWLGGDTVPPISYTDLSRPPALPKRPSLGVASSSDRTTERSASYSKAMDASAASTLAPINSNPARTSRTPSPEKRGKMLRTLRTGREGAKSAPKLANTMRNNKAPAAAGKAAGLAWGVPSPALTPSVPLEAGAAATAYTSRSASFRPSGEKPRPSDTSSASYFKPRNSWVADGESTKQKLPHVEVAHATTQGTKPASRRTLQASIPPTAAQTFQAALTPQTHESQPLDPLGKLPRYRKEYIEKQGQPIKKPGNMSSRSSSDPTDPSVPLTPRRKPVPKVEPTRIAESGARLKRIEKTAIAQPEDDLLDSANSSMEQLSMLDNPSTENDRWKAETERVLKSLPPGVDEAAAKQILNDIVIHGDEVHWSDVAGLDNAKNALLETVVYPFLRPELYTGLREPARGMLLFGPPGTGKTMLARAVATESTSTFFAISASSLTSKFLGESEKLVRALFALAKTMAPSIIFVDEIDSLLSARSGGNEHEATRRIKTEFFIQWSDLAKAAAGREQSDKEKSRGDASRVLVLAATNLPWEIDEAARRRFVRRQYIPLPEAPVRKAQIKTLLSHQKHDLTDKDLDDLMDLTDGFSGSDVTALAKDAAMGPLRSLGEKLLLMKMDEIRPIQLEDFKASLTTIRPSVSKKGLQQFEDWAKEFGERGG